MGPRGQDAAKLCKEEKDALRSIQWGKCHGKKKQRKENSIWGNNSQSTHRRASGLLGGLGCPQKRVEGTAIYPCCCLQQQFGKSRCHAERTAHKGPPQTQASNSALISNSVCQGELNLGLQQPRHRALRTNKNSFGARSTGFLALSSGGPGPRSRRMESSSDINT